MKLWTRVVSCRNAVWEMAPDVDGMVHFSHRTPPVRRYRHQCTTAMHAPAATLPLAVRTSASIGRGKSRFLTCDLSHDYVSINADYRS